MERPLARTPSVEADIWEIAIRNCVRVMAGAASPRRVQDRGDAHFGEFRVFLFGKPADGHRAGGEAVDHDRQAAAKAGVAGVAEVRDVEVLLTHGLADVAGGLAFA